MWTQKIWPLEATLLDWDGWLTFSPFLCISLLTRAVSQQVATAMTIIGAMIGGLFAAYPNDHFGRSVFTHAGCSAWNCPVTGLSDRVAEAKLVLLHVVQAQVAANEQHLLHHRRGPVRPE